MMYESDPSNTKHLGRIASPRCVWVRLGPRLARLAEGLDHQGKEQAARAQSIAQNMAALTAHLDEATHELLRSSNDVEAALTTVAQSRSTCGSSPSTRASKPRVRASMDAGSAVVVEEVQRLADKTGRRPSRSNSACRTCAPASRVFASMTGVTEGKQARYTPF